MLFHPTSQHIPFDASLYYFVGIFDIYDREETKGEELARYNPNDNADRENLILKYCLDPYNKLSYRHKYKLVESLSLALNTEILISTPTLRTIQKHIQPWPGTKQRLMIPEASSPTSID